ncbi:MAG: hypothetical protein M0D57_08210 [Sphingobacteriales bacterium JAD_PAG50586_3]|nr:MAG: hypothetical protein M0D57_08210 [Sphingobacteriales bacterium JAD_PAG50586_3]
MKKLIILSAYTIIALISISCITKRGNANEKFMYIIVRPNASVNQSSNCFFSTVIKHSSNCSKDQSPYEFFTKAGKLFFTDIAKKYNLVIEDWILEFAGDDVNRYPIPGLSNYFENQGKAENARATDIKKLSNKTGGKYELIESPHTYSCD